PVIRKPRGMPSAGGPRGGGRRRRAERGPVMKRIFPPLILFFSLSMPARAQGERFEVGQRLRAFDAARGEQTDEAARRRALKALPPVVSLFLKGQSDEVARTLDQARHALRSDREPPAEVRWAESLYARPATRLADTALPAIEVTLAPFYKVDEGV